MERWERERSRDLKATSEAMAILPAPIERLRLPGATEVHLFGSLAEARFHEHSDIDLAVRGLDGHALFKTPGELARLSPFPLEIVSLDDLSPGLQFRIQELGKQLL